MLIIARRQLLDGLLDAKFLYTALIVVLVFAYNAVVFSGNYESDYTDYRMQVAEQNNQLEIASRNLQEVGILHQTVLQPPSAVAFIASGGGDHLPNAIEVNGFSRYQVSHQHRENEYMTILPELDWVFIIGILLPLLAILISYNSVSGEKQDGTLKLVLSQSVSRMSFFGGKFTGMLLTMLICLFTGVLINLTIVAILGTIPLTSAVLWLALWSVLLAVVYVSLFLFIGMMVSSMTANPSVALVISLIIWILLIFAIPGTGRLLSEQMIDVPSEALLTRELNDEQEQVFADRPKDAANWDNNPFDENIPDRAQLAKDQLAVSRKYFDRQIDAELLQSKTAGTLASTSPYGLLSTAYQQMAGSGIYGFEVLNRNTKTYQDALYQFLVERDSSDSGTPHLVYGWADSFDPGVFSQKPVPANLIPRASDLWKDGGLPKTQEAPVLQLVILIFSNLSLAALSFLALHRYDPR